MRLESGMRAGAELGGVDADLAAIQAPTDELLDGGFVGPAGVGRAFALDRQLLEMVDAVEFGGCFRPENEIGHWISPYKRGFHAPCQRFSRDSVPRFSAFRAKVGP